MRDIDIRRVLRDEMAHAHRDEPETLVVEELGLCQGGVRVDMAVVNGSVHGYEIKSEQDTLTRLPAQAEAYSRTFDYVTLITSREHARKAKSIVPKWWGVQLATIRDGRVCLQPSRQPRRNPTLDPYSFAQLLWRDEALALLEERGLASGVRSKPRDVLWRRLAQTLNREDLGAAVRTCLKRRGSAWRERESRA